MDLLKELIGRMHRSGVGFTYTDYQADGSGHPGECVKCVLKDMADYNVCVSYTPKGQCDDWHKLGMAKLAGRVIYWRGAADYMQVMSNDNWFFNESLQFAIGDFRMDMPWREYSEFPLYRQAVRAMTVSGCDFYYAGIKLSLAMIDSGESIAGYFPEDQDANWPALAMAKVAGYPIRWSTQSNSLHGELMNAVDYRFPKYLRYEIVSTKPGKVEEAEDVEEEVMVETIEVSYQPNTPTTTSKDINQHIEQLMAELAAIRLLQAAGYTITK